MPSSHDFTSDPSEIILDPDNRWWVSRLNRMALSQQGQALPQRVHLRDCTLREGEETPGTHLSRAEKLSLAQEIQALGIKELEVGYCGAVDEHYSLVRFLREGGITAKLASLNRSYAQDGEWQREVDRAVDAGADVIHFILFCNDDLLASVPWLAKANVPQRVYDCVSYACHAGVEATVTLAGASRTGLRWVELCSRAAAQAGASVVGVADSMGCALPETISMLIYTVRDAIGPGRPIGFHGHNSFGLATANALAAVRAGAQVIDAVPLGLGEGAGIAPLEEIAFALTVLYGIETGVDVRRVANLARHVAQIFGVEYLPTKTFVGEGLYRHSIDSHIASILRGAWYSWETVHPSVVGQERRLEFGFAKIRQGRSGAIGAKIEKMGLKSTDEQLSRIIRQVEAITEEKHWATEREVEEVIRQVLADGESV